MQPRSLCSKILHFPGGISLDCSFCLDVAWDFVCHVRERHGFIQAEKATSLNITSVKRCRATAHIRGRSKRNMLKKTTHFKDVIPWSILLDYQQHKNQDFETTVSNVDWLLCYGKPRRCTIFFRGCGVAIEKSVSRQTSWAVFVDSLKEKVNSPRWRYWNWLIGILASWVVNVM